LISYLIAEIPQSYVSLLIDFIIYSFNVALSSKVLSRESLPISDLIVVYAKFVIAEYMFSTLYDAFYGSTISI